MKNLLLSVLVIILSASVAVSQETQLKKRIKLKLF